MNVNVYRGNPEFLRKKWSLYAEVPYLMRFMIGYKQDRIINVTKPLINKSETEFSFKTKHLTICWLATIMMTNKK